MIWVGLTGGIASGKSTATQILKRLGYAVVDADEIAKQVVSVGSEGLKQIVQAFGPGVLSPDQSLDRKKMAARVFTNSQELATLEGIIHPLVRQRVAQEKNQAEKNGTAMAFYDVPLLFEKKLQGEFDCVLLISCSEEMQKQRLRSRNHLSEDEILARLQSQIALSEKETMADYIVSNETTLQDLEIKLIQVCEKIKKRN